MTHPIIINFETKDGLDKQIYQIMLKDINEAFLAAKDNIEAMENLNQLSKELRLATECAIDALRYGPLKKKENILPESDARS